MALEIARLLNISKVILISSVKERKEIPTWMKLCGKCHLENILPRKPLTTYPVTRVFRPVQNYFLGAKTEEEIRMANEYRDKVDPFYLKWSINKIFNWSIDWKPSDFIHIHGNNDHIFPIKYVRPTHIIDGGGHFMVMNKHEQISKIINDFL